MMLLTKCMQVCVLHTHRWQGWQCDIERRTMCCSIVPYWCETHLKERWRLIRCITRFNSVHNTITYARSKHMWTHKQTWIWKVYSCTMALRGVCEDKRPKWNSSSLVFGSSELHCDTEVNCVYYYWDWKLYCWEECYSFVSIHGERDILVYAQILTCAHICMHIHTTHKCNTHTYTCMHTHVHVHCALYTVHCVSACIHMHLRMHAYTCTYACMHTAHQGSPCSRTKLPHAGEEERPGPY